MKALTLDNIPDHLMDRLREQAQKEQRTITEQMLHILANALSAPAGTEGELLDLEIHTQVAAWRHLAGGWVSDRDAEDEIEEIYAARTAGREVEL